MSLLHIMYNLFKRYQYTLIKHNFVNQYKIRTTQEIYV